MNLQELKQKLEKEFSEVMYKCSELHDEFDRLFEQYEKENQASENPLDKYDIQYSPFELVENLRKDMQKEIEPIQKEIFELSCFRKKFGECLDDQRNDLNLLKKYILDLQDELLTLKRDLKFEKEQENPKQERFTFREYKELDTISKMYDVLDSKNKLYFRTLFEYTQAKDVCENLNSLAKGE